MRGDAAGRGAPGLRWRRWVLALALGGLPAGSAVAAETRHGVVEFVPDGDTVFVGMASGPRLKCRLVGIDAPEVRHRRRDGTETPGQPFGMEAKRTLEQWALRRQVSVEVHGRDAYRRSLCVIHQAGRNLNLELVREGYAWVGQGRRVDAPAALRRDLMAAEAGARSARRGLWADPDPEPPWLFRRRAGRR